MHRIIYISILMFFVVYGINTSYAYSDIEPNYWAYEDISELSKNGILSGYPDGTFKPNNNISRAEFITMLVKIIEPNADVLSDTEFWAGGSIKIAKEKNILIEKDYSEFDPNKEITRREICLMIYRSIEGVENVDIDKLNAKKAFKDISSNEQEERIVAILSHIGVLSGYPDNTAGLDKFSTRAELSCFINKFVKSRCILLSVINDNELIAYENDVAVVDKTKLPMELKKWRYTEDIPYVTTTIKNITLFSFNNPPYKYKEVFDNINLSENKYMQFRKKFGEGNYVVAVEFETTNNTLDCEVYAGYEFLHISFPEDMISIVDAFDTDEINRQLNYNANTGQVVRPGESWNTSAFYVVSMLPESKIRFDRNITELYNINKMQKLPCTSFHSLFVRLESR